MKNVKRILVPVDFSAESNFAVEWAVFLLRNTPEAAIHLLHVFSYRRYADYMVWNDNQVDERWDDEKRELERWQDKIPNPIKSDFIIAAGPVARAVQDACAKYAIDLIVMITRSRRGLPRLLRPNTSEEIVRVAPCPALVLHVTPAIMASRWTPHETLFGRTSVVNEFRP